MLIVLEIAPEMKGLDRCHHFNVTINGQGTSTGAATGAGTIKYRQMRLIQVRRPFQGHCSTTKCIRRLNVSLGKP